MSTTSPRRESEADPAGAPKFRLATIGYEGQAQSAVIARLKAAGVAIVLDVRAVAASRRPGFSKSVLAASLAEAGIDYRHLRALGTPKAGRLAARAGRTAEMHAIYEAHLEEPEAQTQLAQAAEIAGRTSQAVQKPDTADGATTAVRQADVLKFGSGW